MLSVVVAVLGAVGGGRRGCGASRLGATALSAAVAGAPPRCSPRAAGQC
ncbi:hypothetical protein ACWEOE_29380 [Amycolatopsis sp. NPDC004368]